MHNPLIKTGDYVDLMDGLYRYYLPKMPKEEDIWYYNLPKKEQFWKTPANTDFRWLDKDGKLKPTKRMQPRERMEYMEYWRDKWLNGLWIMINGEPTYLTGMHLDHILFNTFKSKHFMYLDAQRLRFYFRDYTNADPRCDGRCWIKPRRAGITAEQITESIRVLLLDYNNNVALQSDTHDKAKSTLLSKIIDTYVKRVDWMRESYYSSNGKIPRASLELLESTVASDENYPLGGWARAFPSTSKAIDGEETMLVTMDELSKWLDVSPYETFEINKKTIVNPGKRGKMDCLSTTGDSKEAAKAVRDWHKLIANSNPKIRNANGKTNSGLYEYFISAIHSMELVEALPKVLDKYGNINKEMAEEYVLNEINQHPKNSKEYIFACYKMPLEKRHALLTITNNTYFSKVRIASRLDELNALPNDKKPYVRGRLEEDQKGRVYFEPDDNGKWLVAIQPYVSLEKNIDTRNRFKKNDRGVFFPPINPEGGIGYDPIRSKREDTSSSHLSNAAIVVCKKHDYFGSGITGYAAIYVDRPDDPHDANKECIKACKFWGYPCMHERVIESVKEDFEEANMLPFLLKNPKDGLYGIWIDSQGKIVKNALNLMITRFAAPKTEEDVDQIAVCPFEDILIDMDGFDIANTTSFDVFMAMVELEHGLRQIDYTNQTDGAVKQAMSLIHELIPHRN